MITYIYGPRGCGKTSNKERFAKHYDCPVYEEAHFFDDTTKQLSNVVILGGESPAEEVVCNALNMKNVSFEDAMKASTP